MNGVPHKTAPAGEPDNLAPDDTFPVIVPDVPYAAPGTRAVAPAGLYLLSGAATDLVLVYNPLHYGHYADV